jgi:hypothetical protein
MRWGEGGHSKVGGWYSLPFYGWWVLSSHSKLAGWAGPLNFGTRHKMLHSFLCIYLYTLGCWPRRNPRYTNMLHKQHVTQTTSSQTTRSPNNIVTNNTPHKQHATQTARYTNHTVTNHMYADTQHRLHTSGLQLDPDLDLADLASACHGYSGADLAALAREAAMHALSLMAQVSRLS